MIGDGERFICRCLREFGEIEPQIPAEVSVQSGNTLPLHDRCGEERKLFQLSNIFDMPVGTVSIQDEYSLFKKDQPSPSDLAFHSSDEDFGVVMYWNMYKEENMMLSKLALRVYATPASSCSSERNFSAVNRIITDDRSRLSSELLKIIMYLRSDSS